MGRANGDLSYIAKSWWRIREDMIIVFDDHRSILELDDT